jgi:GntR family transcriptional regulator
MTGYGKGQAAAPRHRSKHWQIAAGLFAAIGAGEYQPGDRLPGENEIMRDSRVSQGTARQALALLASWGVTEARKGSGVYVRDFRPVIRDSTGHPPGAPGDRDLGIDQIEGLEALPPQHVRDLLALPDGEVATMRSSRFLIDGKPAMLSRSWSVAGRGYAPVRFREDLRVRMLPEPDPDTARLDLPPGTPIVEIIRTAYNASGTPVEVAEITADASAYVFRYDLKHPNGG